MATLMFSVNFVGEYLSHIEKKAWDQQRFTNRNEVHNSPDT